MSERKPIRVFYSPLSERFYASQHYREERTGAVVITGAKYDVTDDIGAAFVAYDLEFRPANEGSESDAE